MSPARIIVLGSCSPISRMISASSSLKSMLPVMTMGSWYSSSSGVITRFAGSFNRSMFTSVD
jgi:hypothetical protein